MAVRETRPAVREQLDAALTAEIRRFEHVWARISGGLYGLLTLYGLVVAATGAAPFGLMLSALCFGYVVYFFITMRLSARPNPPRWIPTVNTVASSTAPWIFLGALAARENAAYALSSWVPPLVFLAVMVGSIIRLRPLHALYNGAASAALFLTLYFAVLLPMLRRDGSMTLVAEPKMQLQRAVLLLIAGGAIAVVTEQLRRVVGRAESAVREQDLFGKYRLVRTIASGGMGEIIEAIYCPEGGFERRVAIKRIREHLADQQTFIDAFREEAELSARLAHPNVVHVMDFGKIGSTYFLAMEFVDGVTLAAVCRRAANERRQLATHIVGFVGGEILSGLAYAHQSVFGEDGRPLRIVHRDICPQNILLSRNGEVKIADFGIARVLGDAVSTQTRTVTGHLGYMAPEQMNGRPMDERCDLFSVAVILWELLACQRLFWRDNEVAMVVAVMTQDVPPITGIRPGLASAWDAFFHRALACDPTIRFGSAQEMAEALAALPGAEKQGAAELVAQLVEAFRERHDELPADAMATRVMFAASDAATVVDASRFQS